MNRKSNTLFVFAAVITMTLLSNPAFSQIRVYHTSGGESIISDALVSYDNSTVNTNLRFTTFFHAEQMLNVDLGRFLGMYSGLGVRNVGFITDDLYQNMGFLGVDDTHPDWNKQTKLKRRTYSLGVPLALKIGLLKKQIFLYGGAEYEWTFHYKQKLFIDGEKFKFSEWTSDRVNAFLPSFFAGVQLPKGLNIKFRYYLDDFLNPAYTGIDFGENVDYSNFGSTGIYYISLAFVTGGKK